jgi:hypothetical protein
MVDDARSVLCVLNGGGPAANSDRCNRRFDGGCTLVAELPADETKRAFGERSHHLACAGGGVIYEFVDHKVAVRAYAQRGLVDKQELNRPRRGRLDPLLVHDPRADPQNAGLSGRRRALRQRIDCCGCADLLGDRGRGRKDRTGEQRRQRPLDILAYPGRHNIPSKTERWADGDREVPDRVEGDIRV